MFDDLIEEATKQLISRWLIWTAVFIFALTFFLAFGADEMREIGGVVLGVVQTINE